MCDCIKDIDERLKPDGQALNASLFEPRRVAVDLIRTDKWAAENRRGKPRLMMGAFCPFCGEKYPTEAETKKSEAA